ncbi:hypothetical protein BpHYR1_006382 [Brachionus plicatilis]|uniref:Uncharacterized protein n=1 Tax=Brachionus plicatilis TaxID=10195 RepID=A0A3M7R687_BRAPC|nr:hypothetical protein BpHYR1_006382 [Brachionus plicatilis]
MLNVAEGVHLGQVELGVQVSSSEQHTFHIVSAGHFVKEAGNVVGVHLTADDELPVLQEHGKADKQQEGIVQLGQLVDQLFFVEVGGRLTRERVRAGRHTRRRAEHRARRHIGRRGRRRALVLAQLFSDAHMRFFQRFFHIFEQNFSLHLLLDLTANGAGGQVVAQLRAGGRAWPVRLAEHARARVGQQRPLELFGEHKRHPFGRVIIAGPQIELALAAPGGPTRIAAQTAVHTPAPLFGADSARLLHLFLLVLLLSELAEKTIGVQTGRLELAKL